MVDAEQRLRPLDRPASRSGRRTAGPRSSACPRTPRSTCSSSTEPVASSTAVGHVVLRRDHAQLVVLALRPRPRSAPASSRVGGGQVRNWWYVHGDPLCHMVGHPGARCRTSQSLPGGRFHLMRRQSRDHSRMLVRLVGYPPVRAVGRAGGHRRVRAQRRRHRPLAVDRRVRAVPLLLRDPPRVEHLGRPRRGAAYRFGMSISIGSPSSTSAIGAAAGRLRRDVPDGQRRTCRRRSGRR